jgi:hypothetical protein
MSAWTVGAHAITAAAKENNNPEMHSMVRRPSQSAAGPATITLATAPIKAAATTKPSVAGVPSNLYSGLIYSSAPAGIGMMHNIFQSNGKMIQELQSFWGIYYSVGNYRKSLNSKTPEGSNKGLRWVLCSSNFVEKIGFGFWILMRRSGKVRGVCVCVCVCGCVCVRVRARAYQQLLRCPILEASSQLPQLLQQLLLP